MEKLHTSEFPIDNHRIAAAAGPHDRCESTLRDLQIDVWKGGGFPFQIMVRVGNIPQRKYWLHK